MISGVYFKFIRTLLSCSNGRGHLNVLTSIRNSSWGFEQAFKDLLNDCLGVELSNFELFGHIIVSEWQIIFKESNVKPCDQENKSI